MVTRPQHRLFTVEDYYRMAQVGILGEDDRVELIEGEIIQMTAIGSRHAACVDRLTATFVRALASRVVVHVQNPVRLSELSEPQPDLALLKPRGDYYQERHPGPDDVLLVVEVADSSLEYDRSVKLPLYAAAGVQEVWVIDLTRDRVESFRIPDAAGYLEAWVLEAQDTVAPLAFPDVTVSVRDVVG